MFSRVIFFIILILFNYSAHSEMNRLIIASTTSTYDTGLLDYVNKEFMKKYNVLIHVLSLGTGQAIIVAKRGDADILLVHDTQSEIKFVKDGYGLHRKNLMYNDYILIGPRDDNTSCLSIDEKMKSIKNNKMIFISRGDESGTHKKEKSLWSKINLNPSNFANWYKKIGQGMGSTLNISNELKAYTLADRGTWISFMNKKNIKVVCENKPPLLNQYGIIAVNPDKNKNVNYILAEIYISWILSEKGKYLINNFKIDNQQLFYFNHE